VGLFGEASGYSWVRATMENVSEVNGNHPAPAAPSSGASISEFPPAKAPSYRTRRFDAQRSHHLTQLQTFPLVTKGARHEIASCNMTFVISRTTAPLRHTRSGAARRGGVRILVPPSLGKIFNRGDKRFEPNSRRGAWALSYSMRRAGRSRIIRGKGAQARSLRSTPARTKLSPIARASAMLINACRAIPSAGLAAAPRRPKTSLSNLLPRITVFLDSESHKCFASFPPSLRRRFFG